jgi:HEAT repeat protein
LPPLIENMMIESISRNGQLEPADQNEGPGQAPGNGDRNVRINAIRALESNGDRHSIKLLVDALKDEHYEIRETAYRAVRKLGQKSMPELVLALKDENFYARMYAALAITDQIVENPDAKYGEAVVDALTHALLDKSIYVRRSAYDALKVIEYNKIFKSLVSSLDNPDDNIRMEAIIALGKIADKRASKPLVRLLSVKDANLRRCIASSLGRLGDRKATGPLIDLLLDPDGHVRKEAVKALGAIRDEKAVSGLLGALKDNEPSVREQAQEALNCFRSFRYVTPFIDVLGDRDVTVRKSAVRALGKVRGAKAIESLIWALADSDVSVREEAQMALACMGKNSLKQLKSGLNDDNDLIRHGAAGALELMSKARVKKRIERSHKLQSPRVWMEIEAAISAYTKEKQASLTSFDI